MQAKLSAWPHVGCCIMLLMIVRISTFQVREKMSDRDPDNMEPFPSVLAMREAKLRDWLAEAGRLGMRHHIACRDFMLNATCGAFGNQAYLV